MRIEEEVFLDDYGMRRKTFFYDRRVHHSYVFVAGNEVYTVIVGSLLDEVTFTRIGYKCRRVFHSRSTEWQKSVLTLSTVWEGWLIFAILNLKD